MDNKITTKHFKRKAGIYVIKNLINGKVYIGQTKSVYNRLISHKNALLNNKHENQHLQRSFNKNGIKNFKFNVIEYCEISKLTEKEKFYISKQKECYNIREASDSVIHPKRQPIADETRLKLSNVKKGKIPSNLYDIQQKNRRKIAYYINDELIKIFNSCKDAAEYFGLLPNSFHNYIGKIIGIKKESKYFLKNTKFEYYE